MAARRGWKVRPAVVRVPRDDLTAFVHRGPSWASRGFRRRRADGACRTVAPGMAPTRRVLFRSAAGEPLRLSEARSTTVPGRNTHATETARALAALCPLFAGLGSVRICRTPRASRRGLCRLPIQKRKRGLHRDVSGAHDRRDLLPTSLGPETLLPTEWSAAEWAEGLAR